MAAPRPVPAHPRQAARPAVLAVFNGMAILAGVILFLRGHPDLVLPAALCGGISAGLSVSAGQWLGDAGTTLTRALKAGTATVVGAIIPAVPFAVSPGPAAVAESAAIYVMAGLCAGFARPNRGLGLALTETLGVLAVIFAAVLACTLILPGGAA